MKIRAFLDHLEFLWLNARFPLRPIQDDATLARANLVLFRLPRFDDATISRAQEDYEETLMGLVSDYTNRSRRWGFPTDAATLATLMESRDLLIQELADASGLPPTRIIAILSGGDGPDDAEKASLCSALNATGAIFTS